MKIFHQKTNSILCHEVLIEIPPCKRTVPVGTNKTKYYHLKFPYIYLKLRLFPWYNILDTTGTIIDHYQLCQSSLAFRSKPIQNYNDCLYKLPISNYHGALGGRFGFCLGHDSFLIFKTKDQAIKYAVNCFWQNRFFWIGFKWFWQLCTRRNWKFGLNLLLYLKPFTSVSSFLEQKKKGKFIWDNENVLSS
jgi:hypothetical protein